MIIRVNLWPMFLAHLKFNWHYLTSTGYLKQPVDLRELFLHNHAPSQLSVVFLLITRSCQVLKLQQAVLHSFGAISFLSQVVGIVPLWKSPVSGHNTGVLNVKKNPNINHVPSFQCVKVFKSWIWTGTLQINGTQVRGGKHGGKNMLAKS